MSGIAYLLITIVIYAAAQFIYKQRKNLLFSPMLLTPLALITVLSLQNIPYETFNAGTHWLSDLLQPATVAFAIPLYKYFDLLKKHVHAILISVLTGSVLAIITTILLAVLCNIEAEIAASFAPRSITTPFAMAVSETIGGIPNLTANFVIVTGMLGSILGPLLIRVFKIESDIAKGVLLGMGAHAVGTSKAFELGDIEGTISCLSMILAAIITVLIGPNLINYTIRFLG